MPLFGGVDDGEVGKLFDFIIDDKIFDSGLDDDVLSLIWVLNEEIAVVDVSILFTIEGECFLDSRSFKNDPTQACKEPGKELQRYCSLLISSIFL